MSQHITWTRPVFDREGPGPLTYNLGGCYDCDWSVNGTSYVGVSLSCDQHQVETTVAEPETFEAVAA